MNDWLTIEYPISTNKYWRNNYGRMTVSPEAKKFKERLQWKAKAEGVELIDGPVEFRMRLYPHCPQDWKKRERHDPDWYHNVRCIDTDNALKVVLDALQGVAYTNDNQVHKISVERMIPDEGQERAEVLIRSLKEV